MDCKYQIKQTKIFTKEFRTIYKYIDLNLRAHKAVHTMYYNTIKKIKSLEIFPERNEIIVVQNKHKLRKIQIKNYVILYEVIEKDKTLLILHMFHNKQNYLNIKNLFQKS